MNLPAICAQTYNRYKDHSPLIQITRAIFKKLKKISDPIKRARLIHREIDQAIEEVFEDTSVKNFVSCRKGCSACCHTQVSVTQDEAKLLANLVTKGMFVDLYTLRQQAEAGNRSDTWYGLSHNQRRCPFLGSNNECRVYADRPSVCRTNYVVSEPKLCSTEDGTEKPIRLLKTDKANMIMAAHFLANEVNGALPKMLWDALDNADLKFPTDN